MKFREVRELATTLTLFVSIFVLSGARVLDGACYMGYCTFSYFMQYGFLTFWVCATITYILFSYQRKTSLAILSIYLFLVVFVPVIFKNNTSALIGVATVLYTPALLIVERILINPLERDLVRYKYEEEFGR